MVSDTMTVLTERKPRTEIATSWNCKECGACLGGVKKDNKGWHLILSGVSHVRIYGDAEITCLFCGRTCKWFWNEHALKRVLRYRERRV